MKNVTDLLSVIAADLDVDFLRTMTLTETDVENHYRNSTKDLMVYNGAGTITVQFNGAEIVDVIASEVYFLTKAPSKDVSGNQLDDALAITKRYADKTYAALNLQTAEDIEPYELQGVSVLSDVFLGHLMTIGIPLYNEGC